LVGQVWRPIRLLSLFVLERNDTPQDAVWAQ